ncbi:hypothetical protein HDE_07579 [Halotydeus destructor]|nr:hypothetical protein HDE_07579 [Halotydeus destructor]
MITKTAIFLTLVVTHSSAQDFGDDFSPPDNESNDLKSKDDFTSLTDTDKARLKQAVDKHIPFEVDDKLYKGKKFRCVLDRRHFENGPYNRRKYYNFTLAQKDCHKQHEAKMKQADYGDYSYCIVDNFNRMAESRDHMSLTPDNKTIYSQGLYGIVGLAGLILDVEHFPTCRDFCGAHFLKFTQNSRIPDVSPKSFITGPAINVLRQFRRCLGLSKLLDKYKWPAPK